MAPYEELVHQQAERVDVSGRGDGLAPHLLGGGVLRREHADVGTRRYRSAERPERSQDLADAEVQKLWDAFVRYQDVGVLDVAVNHEILMRVLNGPANGLEQPEPSGDREPVGVTELIDGHPLDVLHHEVRSSVLRCPAVVELRDVGMMEARQNLSLEPEAPEDFVGVEPAADELQSYGLSEIVRLLHGEIHVAHSAPPERAHQPVGPDVAGLDRFGQSIRIGQLGQPDERRIHEPRLGVVFDEEALDLAEQLGVAATGLLHIRCALFGWLVQRGQAEGLDLFPAGGIHGLAAGADRIASNHAGASFWFTPSSRRNQILAAVQARRTVTSEVPNTSAISRC